MVALAQQVQVVVGEQGREPIGVFQLHLAVVELRAQAIALRSVDGAGEQAGRVDALQFTLTVLADRDHAARVGQEHPHHGFVVLGVRTEIGEGIGVAAGDDVACDWRKRAHEVVSPPGSGLITPRRSRMRKAASIGICDQLGRLLNSYSIS